MPHPDKEPLKPGRYLRFKLGNVEQFEQRCLMIEVFIAGGQYYWHFQNSNHCAAESLYDNEAYQYLPVVDK